MSGANDKKPARAAALPLFAVFVFLLGTPVLNWLRVFAPRLPGAVFWPVFGTLTGSMMLSFLLPRGRVSRFLHRLGEAVFPLSLLLAAFSIPAELLCRFGLLPRRETGLAVVVLFAACCATGVWNAFRVRVKTYDVLLRKPCPDTRMVLISDLHLGVFTDRNLTRRIAAAVAALEPDVILLAGDLFDDRFTALKHPEEALAGLKELCAVAPVYACEGNHDRADDSPEKSAFIEESGIRWLTDERLSLPCGEFVFRRDYRCPNRLSAEEILAGADASRPVIVVDHNPAEYRKLWAAGADLTLSGHTHGGQIFPGNVLYKFAPLFSHGMKRKNGKYAVVTSGAGFYGFPVRVGVNTEAVLLRVRGEESTQPQNGR